MVVAVQVNRRFFVKLKCIFLFFLKTQLDDQEAKSQEMYLEMYRKGQNSAQFEREEEVHIEIAYTILSIIFPNPLSLSTVTTVMYADYISIKYRLHVTSLYR